MGLLFGDVHVQVRTMGYILFFVGGDMFLILSLLIMLSGFDIISVIRFSHSGAQIIIFFNLSDFWFIFFFFNQIVK